MSPEVLERNLWNRNSDTESWNLVQEYVNFRLPRKWAALIPLATANPKLYHLLSATRTRNLYKHVTCIFIVMTIPRIRCYYFYFRIEKTISMRWTLLKFTEVINGWVFELRTSDLWSYNSSVLLGNFIPSFTHSQSLWRLHSVPGLNTGMERWDTLCS